MQNNQSIMQISENKDGSAKVLFSWGTSTVEHVICHSTP